MQCRVENFSMSKTSWELNNLLGAISILLYDKTAALHKITHKQKGLIIRSQTSSYFTLIHWPWPTPLTVKMQESSTNSVSTAGSVGLSLVDKAIGTFHRALASEKFYMAGNRLVISYENKSTALNFVVNFD